MDTRCPNCGAKLASNLVAAIKDPLQPDVTCLEPTNAVPSEKFYQH